MMVVLGLGLVFCQSVLVCFSLRAGLGCSRESLLCLIVPPPQTLEEHPGYTEEELQRFEAELVAREAELAAQAQRLSQESKALDHSQGLLKVQKKELQ